MHIALDYDHCYTVSPAAWDACIAIHRAAGNEVSIVTFRDDRFDMTPMLVRLRDELQVPVICTRGIAKRFYCENFYKPVDVWIDDRPEGILTNSGLSPEQLAEWRAADRIAHGVGVEIERPAA